MYIETSLAAGKKSVIMLIVMPISRPADDGAEQASHAADDDGDERGHEQRVPGRRVEPELRAGEHAREPGEQYSQARS